MRVSPKRFGEALSLFREDQGITTALLATIIRRPASTVYKWLRGETAPSAEEANAICEKLSINFKRVTSEGEVMGSSLYRNFLDFSVLQQRYQEWVESDPVNSPEIVNLASVVVLNRFLREHVICELMQTSVAIGMIAFVNGSPYVVLVKGTKGKILIEVVLSEDKGQSVLVEVLTEKTFQDVKNLVCPKQP